ncbi:putative uncharacterized protein FLJ44672 [Aotus nancymaae]|uniref:putative uncharacterized protein FLJ44672 n=1 Tax=Aotus nancymaae TaxID=37293 RepID=UPI0030FF14FD
MLASSLGPGPPSQQPSSAQLAYHGLSRTSYCLPAACPGPKLLLWAWPLQARLLPVPGPSGPSLCLSVDPPGPARAIMASRVPALPLSGIYRPNFRICLVATYVDSAPAQLLDLCRPKSSGPQLRLSRSTGSCLTLASPGSAPALPGLLQAPNVPESASAGPVPAASSRWPREAQALGPEVGLSRPSSCPPGVSSPWAQNVLTWAPPGPAPASQRPPGAQLLLPISLSGRSSLCLPLAASPGPDPPLWLHLLDCVLPPSSFFWLSSWPASSCLSSVGPKLPQVGLSRPPFCLPLALTGPATA